ncbi:MAG: radical SAM protein [Rudaea sp.]
MTVEGPGQEQDLFNPYTQILARSEKQHKLLSAHWELTYRCNVKCAHCYLDVFYPRANVAGELTTDESLRLVDDLADLGVLNLTLSGGEILVHRDFFRIAEYARSKRFLLRLFTNGILITPTVADRIAALHPYAVEISLYSTRPERHDRITGLDRSWELTTRAFRLLHERGVRTLLKTPLMRENAEEIDSLESFAHELGAGFRVDTTVTPKDSGDLSPFAHRAGFEQLVAYFQSHADPHKWLERTVTDEERTCGIGSKAIAISPYGNVFPCVQVRLKAGSVRETPLRDIWDKPAVWQELSRLTIGELPVCRSCELRSLCIRCQGLSLVEGKDLRAPALANCRSALARRQALISRGVLPADYPIPPHLTRFAENLAFEPIPGDYPPDDFIPLTALTAQPGALTAQVEKQFS